MGAKSQDARLYPVPIGYFVEKLRNIDHGGLNLNLKSENPIPSGVWFRIHHGATFTSWGEKITVTLEYFGASTGVSVLSECGLPTQVVDWGKNASNVRAIFAYLEKDMPAPAPGAYPAAPQQPGAYAPQPAANPVPAAAQPAASQPAPADTRGPAQTAPRFCPGCGKPVQAGAKFCSGCGTRLG